jgi:hypothetical protein
LRTFALFLVVFALGCQSTPTEATDAELAFHDEPADGPVPEFGPTTKGPSTTETAQKAPAPGAPAAPKPGTSASDQGPLLTIVYVTEIRIGARRRPGAVIFASDPDSGYLQEEPRPSRVLKPIDRADMARLLLELRAAGLDLLPHQDLADSDPITGERQIIFVRDGKRVVYLVSASQSDANAFKAFNRCEKVLLDRAHGPDSFVETKGREATPSMTPLNDNLPGHDANR